MRTRTLNHQVIVENKDHKNMAKIFLFGQEMPRLCKSNFSSNFSPMQRTAINSPGIPSLLDIRVQRPVHMPNGYHRPSMQMPNGQGLGPNPLVTMPNVPMARTAGPPRNNYPMINTSVPPPRITLLQKPQRATPPSAAMQPQLLTRPQVTSIANPGKHLLVR